MTKHLAAVLPMSVLIGAMLGGCLDASPVIVPKEGPGPLTPVADAGSAEDAEEVDSASDGPQWRHPECRACIEAPNDPGPGCANQLAAAAATPLGMELFNRAYEKGCVTKLTRPEALNCAIPIADSLGLKNPNLPEIQTALVLTECFDLQCGDVCKIGD